MTLAVPAVRFGKILVIYPERDETRTDVEVVLTGKNLEGYEEIADLESVKGGGTVKLLTYGEKIYGHWCWENKFGELPFSKLPLEVIKRRLNLVLRLVKELPVTEDWKNAVIEKIQNRAKDFGLDRIG